MEHEANGSPPPYLHTRLQLLFSPPPHLRSNQHASQQRVIDRCLPSKDFDKDNAGENLGAEEFDRDKQRRVPCSYQNPNEDTVVSVHIPAPVSSPVGQESERSICRDEWNDAATFALLEAWGTKFLHLRRGNLRLEDWAEVAETVTAVSKNHKTDVQCKDRLDSLKKKFKLEKQKRSAVGSTRSKWPFYKHLEWMLSNAPRRTGLPGAVDAGQMVGPIRNKSCAHLEGKVRLFSDTSATSKAGHCRERSCDSPTLSPAGEVSGDQLPRKRRCKEAPLKTLVKAIFRFVEVYERIEQHKQKQLVDLERVRMEFTKNLELQRLQLFMQARLELARMKHGNIDFNASISNMSG